MERLESLRLPAGTFPGPPRMKIIAQDAFKYLLASGCALLVDFAVLWVLVQYFFWWYLAAATVSFLSGMIAAYLLSVTWVFDHRRLDDRRIEFLSFAAIGGTGAAINAGVILLAVGELGVHYLIAKGIAAGFTFTFNFFARRQLLFASPIRDHH
jgi:putative flippase GtrA